MPQSSFWYGQPGRACPQRRPNGDLLLAAHRARQKQVGDIETGNQQQQAHCTQEKVERLLKALQAGIRERPADLDNPSFIGAEQLPASKSSSAGR